MSYNKGPIAMRTASPARRLSAAVRRSLASAVEEVHFLPRVVVLLAAATVAVTLGEGAGAASSLTASTAGSRTNEELGVTVPVPYGVERVRTDPKLGFELEGVARAAQVSALAGNREALSHRLAVRGTRVRVVLDTHPGKMRQVRATVTRRGGLVERESHRLLQALIPVRELRAVAKARAIRFVRRPLRSIEYAVPGQGVQATNAATWHPAGITGAGVKVAIIDSGFVGLAARQAGGDLPANVTKADFCAGRFGADSGHGTAVAEVVHEMAPAAQLFLICERTEVDFASAVAYARQQGANVINYSKGFPGASRGDGNDAPGYPDAVIAAARSAGILWVNAAGNHGEQHWSGTFTDNDVDGFLDYTAADEGNTHIIPSGGVLCANLKWDDWPMSAQDYDFALHETSTGAVVAASADDQTGTQRPVEAWCYKNTGTTRSFDIRIARASGSDQVRLDLFTSAGELEYQVPEGSVVEQAASPFTLAVGAVCWHDDLSPAWSPRGPTIDGRVKPDIAGQTQVSSATYGLASACRTGGGFGGTSASAPHVAGAAALAKQRFPSYSAADLTSYLETNAVDRGAAGKDNVFGAGRLTLPAMVSPPQPPPPPQPDTSDYVAPVARAIRSNGRRGATAKLRYYVNDNRGRTRETVTIYRGSKRLTTLRTYLARSRPGALHRLAWRIPARSPVGGYRFCVVATDSSGNESARSCATLKVS